MNTLKVRKLPVDTGRSGWEAIAPRTFPARALDGDITADWLIIGAGFAGLAAARRVTQLHPGARIAVVDARKLALGPAGRNSGYMIDVPHNVSTGGYAVGDANDSIREMALNRFAIDFAKQAAAEYEMPVETFDPCGKINAAATANGEKHNADFSGALARIGEPYRLLDTAEMRELTGTGYYRSGVFTPGAVLIEPADYIRRFAQGLGSKIALYENSPVTELARAGKEWTARTPRGSVTAAKVILGVNGHIQSFGHFKGRLMHVFTYASMTAPFHHKAGRDRWALLPADPMGATIRKITHAEGSRIVIRSRFTYNPDLETTEGTVRRMAKTHRASFDARYPDLRGLPFDYSWGGRLCLSWNHSPAFGEVEENVYSACCENGLGTVKSTLAGIMAVDLASGRQSEQLDIYRNHVPPSRLPPAPIATIGARIVIRLQEIRAGREG